MTLQFRTTRPKRVPLARALHAVPKAVSLPIPLPLVLVLVLVLALGDTWGGGAIGAVDGDMDIVTGIHILR